MVALHPYIVFILQYSNDLLRKTKSKRQCLLAIKIVFPFEKLL